MKRCLMAQNARTVYGYDGNGYSVGDRVELHPGLDLWMAGARFGRVTHITDTLTHVRSDNPQVKHIVRSEHDRFQRAA